MTFTPTEVRSTEHLDSAYVDWAAVVGGALVAVAIFTTLMVFGSAVGLSLTSADPGPGVIGKGRRDRCWPLGCVGSCLEFCRRWLYHGPSSSSRCGRNSAGG